MCVYVCVRACVCDGDGNNIHAGCVNKIVETANTEKRRVLQDLEQ